MRRSTVRHARATTVFAIVCALVSFALPASAFGADIGRDAYGGPQTKAALLGALARPSLAKSKPTSGVRSANFAPVKATANVPGVPLPTSPVSFYLDSLGPVWNVVWSVYLKAGDTFVGGLAPPVYGTHMMLFPPGTVDIFSTTPIAASSAQPDGTELMGYDAPSSGTYYIEAFNASSYGWELLTWGIWEPTVLALQGPSDITVESGTSAGPTALLYDYYSGGVLPGEPVKVYTSSDGVNWNFAATVYTDSNGYASYQIPVTSKTYFGMAYDGSAAWGNRATNLDYNLVVTPVFDTVTSAIDMVSPNPAGSSTSVSFAGHGVDSLGHPLTSYRWRSSINGVLSSSSSFSTASLSSGTHTIYFQSMCSHGTWSPEVGTQLTVLAPLPVATALSGSSGTKTTAYNGALTIYADLYAGTAPLSAKPVILEYSSNGSTGWTPATASVIQPIPGRYQASVQRTSALYFRFRFSGDSAYYAATGPVVKVYPKAYVTNPVAPTYAYRGRYFTVYGYLKPRHTAGSYPVRIYKYRYVSGVWKSYGYITAKASTYYSYTKYSRSISLPYAGRWRLRTYAPADSGHAATWSTGYDYMTIK